MTEKDNSKSDSAIVEVFNRLKNGETPKTDGRTMSLEDYLKKEN